MQADKVEPRLSSLKERSDTLPSQASSKAASAVQRVSCPSKILAQQPASEAVAGASLTVQPTQRSKKRKLQGSEAANSAAPGAAAAAQPSKHGHRNKSALPSGSGQKAVKQTVASSAPVTQHQQAQQAPHASVKEAQSNGLQRHAGKPAGKRKKGAAEQSTAHKTAEEPDPAQTPRQNQLPAHASQPAGAASASTPGQVQGLPRKKKRRRKSGQAKSAGAQDKVVAAEKHHPDGAAHAEPLAERITTSTAAPKTGAELLSRLLAHDVLPNAH